MHQLIQFAKCMSDPVAVRVVVLLQSNDLTMPELQRVLELPRGRVDDRLSKLRQVGVVDADHDGRWLRFRINPGARSMISALLDKFEHEVMWHESVTDDQARLERLAKVG